MSPSARRRRGRRRLVVVVALLVVAGLAAIVGDDGDEPQRRSLGPTTTRPDLSGVELGRVEGTTTTTVPENAGDTSLSGTVRTEDGEAVPGATVRAEWLRADPADVIEVTTDDAGEWRVEEVAGGRWRVRAWRTPDHASVEDLQLFLEDGEARGDLELPVRFVPRSSVMWDVEPDPPIVDHNTTLVVQLAERSVDLEGRTVTTALSSLDVRLGTGGAWLRVRGDATETADGEGRVEWVLRCEETGSHPIRVASDEVVEEIEVPACIPISATSTTSTIPPDDGDDDGDGDDGDDGGDDGDDGGDDDDDEGDGDGEGDGG